MTLLSVSETPLSDLPGTGRRYVHDYAAVKRFVSGWFTCEVCRSVQTHVAIISSVSSVSCLVRVVLKELPLEIQ